MRRETPVPGPSTAEPLPAPEVAVLEVEPEGHRLQYLAHLVRAAGPRRCLVLTTAQARAAPEFRTHLDAGRDGGLRVVELAPGGRVEVLAAALDTAARAGVSRLVVPDGDRHVLPLLRWLTRRAAWRPGARRPGIMLLLMRTDRVGGPGGVRVAAAAKPMLVQLLRLTGRVDVRFLTDAHGVVTRRRGYPGVRPVRDPVALPGPAPSPPDRAAVRPAWFPPTRPGAVEVGVFGVVGERKNLPLLVEAALAEPALTVVVGGRLDPPVRAFVDGERACELAGQGRLVVEDRLLGPDEFGAALRAIDVAAVLHDNDAPSGILAESGLRGTPVVVPEGRWLAEVVRDTGAGVATALEPAALGAALCRAGREHDTLSAAARAAAVRLGTSSFTAGLLGS